MRIELSLAVCKATRLRTQLSILPPDNWESGKGGFDTELHLAADTGRFYPEKKNKYMNSSLCMK
jgi:hypothetical protein